MNPLYAVEPLARCRDEIEKLGEAHSREFTYDLDKKGPVAPDWPLFDFLERNRRFRVLTARDGDELVGYFFILTTRSTHYDITLCLDDTFYLKPEYRPGWGLYKFCKYAVAEMKVMGGPGCGLVVANKVDQDLAPIWRRLGFRPEEIRWTQMVA